MSSMNGRKWRRIPPGAHLAAQNGIAQTNRICRLSAYAEDEWFRHINQWSIRVADFCGFPRSGKGWFSA